MKLTSGRVRLVNKRKTAIRRAAIVTLAAALLLPVSAYAQAAPPVESVWWKWPAIVFDVMILRPLASVSLVVGAAAFVPVALLTAPCFRKTVL